MGAYMISVLELDFLGLDIRYRDIRNTLATIQSIIGEEFIEQQVGDHHVLIGKDKALVVRKRDGSWIGIR